MVTIPLVIAGVLLSTLHQSSMGSMFLLMPQKIYPLWYSALLPVFLLISSDSWDGDDPVGHRRGPFVDAASIFHGVDVSLDAAEDLSPVVFGASAGVLVDFVGFLGW